MRQGGEGNCGYSFTIPVTPVLPIMSLRRFLFLTLLLVTFTGATANAQVARVVTLADSLVGGVGGIAIDRLNNIYSADFMDTVWRIRPDGRVEKFATGLYGPSGNFFDAQGNLLQSNFMGNYISKIDRNGNHEIWVDEGLNGPVGITIHPEGDVFVTNCPANTISRIEGDKAVEFSDSELLNCPNGITTGPDGALYVVNFSDGAMLRLDLEGNTELFATIPGGGNGHVAVARGLFYVTAFQTNRIFTVSPDGDVSHVAGTGAFAEVDGAPMEASFVFPNGIAVDPKGDRLFVNDYINRTPPGVDIPPVPMANIRMIKLASIIDALQAGLRSGGVEGLEAAYRAYKDDPANGAIYTERDANGMGYALMNQGLLEAAVRLFELNSESYPRSFNAWDSLAEGYLNQERYDEAIEHYQKSLDLNPANQNAKDKIAEIRAR